MFASILSDLAPQFVASIGLIIVLVPCVGLAIVGLVAYVLTRDE